MAQLHSSVLAKPALVQASLRNVSLSASLCSSDLPAARSAFRRVAISFCTTSQRSMTAEESSMAPGAGSCAAAGVITTKSPNPAQITARNVEQRRVNNVEVLQSDARVKHIVVFDMEISSEHPVLR